METGPLAVMVAILVAMVAWQEIRGVAERRRHAHEIARLQRLWKAETLQDYVASESLLTRKPRKERTAPPGPHLYDDMFNVRRRENIDG